MIIQRFTDLIVWKEGHKLVLMAYKYTNKFPNKETYSLVDQMRRAAVSITSNIAEGFGRRGVKEKVQFLYLSLGSGYELQNQIIIARDLDYMTKEEYEKMENQLQLVSKLINGFIRSLQKTSS